MFFFNKVSIQGNKQRDNHIWKVNVETGQVLNYGVKHFHSVQYHYDTCTLCVLHESVIFSSFNLNETMKKCSQVKINLEKKSECYPRDGCSTCIKLYGRLVVSKVISLGLNGTYFFSAKA